MHVCRRQLISLSRAWLPLIGTTNYTDNLHSNWNSKVPLKLKNHCTTRLHFFERTRVYLLQKLFLHQSGVSRHFHTKSACYPASKSHSVSWLKAELALLSHLQWHHTLLLSVTVLLFASPKIATISCVLNLSGWRANSNWAILHTTVAVLHHSF